MNTLQSVLNDVVAAKNVSFAVGMVGTSGGITFSGAAGEAAEGRKAAEDTVFRIFSMTKAIGATAAMILIERGQLSMDTPVADILPEWSKLKVLEGFDGVSPVMREPRTQATIRHLATHTSGLEYEFWNADVPKYLEIAQVPTILSGLKSALHYPLTSDPGTRWGYGISLDWLGQVVEKVDGRRIDAFCQEEIFDPLGMTDTAFEPDGKENRLSTVSMRQEDGGFAPVDLAPPSRPEVYGMGHALYSTAPDYMRFLRMVLRRGELDGNRILTEESIAEMCADQMQGLEILPMVSCAPHVSADIPTIPGVRSTHAFAFSRNEDPIEGKRSAGSLGWAGVCNTHYWLDPEKDVAAVIMTQTLPFLEPGMLVAYDSYERAVYAAL